MSIFDYVKDEFRKNGGLYLKRIFRHIYIDYKLGAMTESEAITMCDEEFDKYSSIYC